ncbi:MAG: thioredoxin-disulfide reductase [Elusimicrobiaceae bacterium]|nr:thioredoxin-disulfide reductase [Elusimicrobiaceae bacterium]
MKTDILIIGCGPSALSAALYTLRAGLKTTILSGSAPGGQLLQTNDIENYAGFVNPISGFELMDNMQKQAKRLGAEIITETAAKVDTKNKKVLCQNGSEYEYLSLIIATGASARWLNIAGEDKFKGKGVSACATCDGFFFKGKEVCVVGGGNTAFEDALFLTNFCPKVYLVHRRDGFRADAKNIAAAKANPKIQMIIPAVVDTLEGSENGLEAVILKNPQTGEKQTIKVQGVFVAIGSVPQTAFLKDSGVLLNEAGQVLVNERAQTNIEGVFASGDCTNTLYRQAIVAAGTGANAGIEAAAHANLLK